MGKQGVAAGVLTFVPGTDFLHFLPDFDPYFIMGFQLHHLYLGALIMIIGLAIAMRSDD
ncbi:MAG: hypothetical protein ACW99G_12340 [Candidatus Thorarchaeota archaeon]